MVYSRRFFQQNNIDSNFFYSKTQEESFLKTYNEFDISRHDLRMIFRKWLGEYREINILIEDIYTPYSRIAQLKKEKGNFETKHALKNYETIKYIFGEENALKIKFQRRNKMCISKNGFGLDEDPAHLLFKRWKIFAENNVFYEDLDENQKNDLKKIISHPKFNIDRGHVVALMLKSKVPYLYNRVTRLFKEEDNEYSHLYYDYLVHGKDYARKNYEGKILEHRTFYQAQMNFCLTILNYDKDEASRKVREIYSRKIIHKTNFHETSSHACTKFWIELGYCFTDAIKLADYHSRKYVTNGKEFYIDKLGLSIDEYNLYQKERNDKWQKSLKEKTEEEKSLISLKKSHSMSGYLARGIDEDTAKIKLELFYDNFDKRSGTYSKASQDLFFLIAENLGSLEFLRFALNGGEKSVCYGKYRLDFFDELSGIAIEFDGAFYHADVRRYKADDQIRIHGKYHVVSDIWKRDEIRKENIRKENIVNELITVLEYDTLKKENFILKATELANYIKTKRIKRCISI